MSSAGGSPLLRALSGFLGIQNQVEFLGFRHDTPVLLRAADFLLLPSTSEGLPLAVLEAQATKVPVLAAPTAGIPEVVRDGETGFLIPSTDAPAYAACLERLLGDAALYQRVAERAYEQTTREYNEQRYWKRIGELYQECVG